MNKPKQSYTVATGKSITELALVIEKMLAEQWELQGGVAINVNFNGGEALFAQALVK